MKYIRTKDNSIIKGTPNFEDTEYFILKQADTIEELCDGWIIECPEWDKPTFKKQLQYIDWKDYIKTANKHKAIHYAVIFVRLPNGATRIEPVAKMNEDGELCLL